MSFIKYFIREWCDYPYFKKYRDFLEEYHPQELKRMEKSDLKRGIKPYKNRFDFALRQAKMRCAYYNDC